MNDLNIVPKTGSFGSSVDVINQNFVLLKDALEQAAYSNMGFFQTESLLTSSYPNPEEGWVAYVGATKKIYMTHLVSGSYEWYDTGLTDSSVLDVNYVGYQYMGVATPSTNPGIPEQNVFYIAGTEGTYTNFSNIVVSGEVAVLKYNGSSWSKENTGIKFVTVLQNTLTIGGNYAGEMSTTYDVTLHNSGATFASLSALLSDANLNTIIPLAVRKGGMSIKYVQSSDNKYVQYRYMLDDATNAADFTNVDNWQGVDESLKPESHNLIESGSVHSELYVATLNGSVSVEQTARYKQQLLSFDANTFYKLGLSVTGLSTTDIDNCSFIRLNHGTTYNSTIVKQIYLSLDDKTKLKNDGYAEWLISLDDTVESLSLWFGINYTPTSGNTVGFSQYIFTEKFIPKTVLNVSKVVTVEPESFTDTQKAQARTNIGAGSAADVSTNATNINELIYDISKNSPTGGVDGSDEYSFDLCQPKLSSLSLWYVIPQELKTKDGQLIKVKSYELKKYITGIIRRSFAPYNPLQNVYYVFWYDAPTELNVTDNSFSSKQSIFESIYKWQLSKTISNDVSSRYGIWALGNSYNRGSYRIKVKLTGMSEADWANIKQISFYGSSIVSSLVQSVEISSQMFENSEYETDVFVLDTFAYLGFFFNSGYTPSQTIGVELSLSIPTEKYASKDNVTIGIMPTNVFGDILPPMFKDKLIAYDKDLLIVCQGDSLTGMIKTADVNPDAAHSCPGGQYNSWVKLCQDIVNKDKIEYNRLDSQRESADFFTKVGTWTWTTYSTIDSGQHNRYIESSSAADTYRSADASPSISFVFDGSVYDKCNIIFSKGNDATTNAAISIAEGNGKMLVSLDRETWVEANGFSHSQFTTAADNAHDFGVARFERHRRLWMKKANADVGTVHIIYSGTNSNGSYMYCWGVEIYKGVAVLFDNIGRGGRSTFMLSYNLSDVFDRKPDLLIYEMPFANEQSSDTDTPTNNYDYWTYPYFVSDGGDTRPQMGGTAVSYKVQSENYTTLPVLFILPHIRSADWEGNESIIPSIRPNMACPMYNFYRAWWGLLYNALKSYSNVKFANILDQVLNEARYRELDYQTALSAGEFTADGIHLNQTLSNIYAKYIAGIFTT